MASPSVRSSPPAGRERRRARASPKRMKAPRTRASPCNSRGLGVPFGGLGRSGLENTGLRRPRVVRGAPGRALPAPRAPPAPGTTFSLPERGRGGGARREGRPRRRDPGRRRPTSERREPAGSVGGTRPLAERRRDSAGTGTRRAGGRRSPPPPLAPPPPASSREAATRGRPRAAPPPAGPGRTAPLAGSRAAGWAEPAPPRDCGSRAWRAGSGRGARGGCCHRRATPRPAPRPAWSPRGGRRTTASPGGTWGRASPARAGQRRGRGRGPERPPAPDRGGERAPSGRRRGRPCRPSGPSPAPRHDRAPRRFRGRAARAPDSPRRRRRMTEAASRWTFCPLRSRADPRAAGQGGAAAVKCTLGKGGPLATAQ